MLKISKKVEYGILALQYMVESDIEFLSVKDISANLELSYEFLSKVMQNLAKKGLIISQQGIKGGYKLMIEPDKLTIMDIIRAFNEKISLVECLDRTDTDCNRTSNCSIKKPMLILQDKIESIFFSTSISDLSSNKRKLDFKLKLELIK